MNVAIPIAREAFVRIKRIAHADMRRWLGVKTPGKQRGACPDCHAVRLLVREHRSYNDPTLVELVCVPCNLRRRSASIVMIDVETLATVPLHYEWKRSGPSPSKEAAA